MLILRNSKSTAPHVSDGSALGKTQAGHISSALCEADADRLSAGPHRRGCRSHAHA